MCCFLFVVLLKMGKWKFVVFFFKVGNEGVLGSFFGFLDFLRWSCVIVWGIGLFDKVVVGLKLESR